MNTSAECASAKARLALVAGALRLFVAKVTPDGNFEVETETATAAVRGTDWMMETTPERPRLRCCAAGLRCPVEPVRQERPSYWRRPGKERMFAAVPHPRRRYPGARGVWPIRSRVPRSTSTFPTGRARDLKLCGLALCIMLAFAGAHLVALDVPWLRRLELIGLDAQMRARGPRPPGPETVIVMIDDAAIARLGRWPVPRARLAELVGMLHRAGARTIGIDILLADLDTPADAPMSR